MRLHLTVISGADRGKELPLDDGTWFCIGRGEDADFRLSDPSVSRQHCALELVDGTWRLTDLKSSSGTFVNGERIRTQVLNPGDRIHAGLTRLYFGDPENRPRRRGSLVKWAIWTGIAVSLLTTLLLLFCVPRGYIVLYRNADGSIRRIRFFPEEPPDLETGQKIRRIW